MSMTIFELLKDSNPKEYEKISKMIDNSEKKKHTYGAFPFTSEGLKKAKAYTRLLKKEHKEKFIVRET